MASMRFENNEFQAMKPGGKVFYFDSSPAWTLGSRYGNMSNFELRDERPHKTGETVWDIYAQTRDSDGPSMKIGQLFYHKPEWPGGPCSRRPTSLGTWI